MKEDAIGYLKYDESGDTLSYKKCQHPSIWRVVIGVHRQGCRLCGKMLVNGRLK